MPKTKLEYKKELSKDMGKTFSEDMSSKESEKYFEIDDKYSGKSLEEVKKIVASEKVKLEEKRNKELKESEESYQSGIQQAQIDYDENMIYEGTKFQTSDDEAKLENCYRKQKDYIKEMDGYEDSWLKSVENDLSGNKLIYSSLGEIMDKIDEEIKLKDFPSRSFRRTSIYESLTKEEQELFGDYFYANESFEDNEKEIAKLEEKLHPEKQNEEKKEKNEEKELHPEKDANNKVESLNIDEEVSKSKGVTLEERASIIFGGKNDNLVNSENKEHAHKQQEIIDAKNREIQTQMANRDARNKGINSEYKTNMAKLKNEEIYCAKRETIELTRLTAKQEKIESAWGKYVEAQKKYDKLNGWQKFWASVLSSKLYKKAELYDRVEGYKESMKEMGFTQSEIDKELKNRIEAKEEGKVVPKENKKVDQKDFNKNLGKETESPELSNNNLSQSKQVNVENKKEKINTMDKK